MLINRLFKKLFVYGKKISGMGVNDDGYTLIELLVTTAIAGIVMTAIFSVFYSQQKTYAAQEQIGGMQQNLRAAIYFIEREVRTAGCDPNGTSNAGIQGPLLATSIHFTMDITDDTGTDSADGSVDDANEDITYSLYDSDGDGVNDALGRDTGSGFQMVAENIDALNFIYLDDAGNETTTVSEVRSVQITVVARTGKGDPGYINTDNYTNKNNEEILAAQNDNFRRRRLAAEVQCRNLWF